MSVAARNRIVEKNLGLARKAAHRFVKVCGLPWEDLYQVGLIGLCKAAERYDPEKCPYFSSFAMPYIIGEIKHELRDRYNPIKVVRSWQDMAAKGAKLKAEGRNDREIASALGIPLEQWLEVEQAGKVKAYSWEEKPNLNDSLIAPTPEESEQDLGELAAAWKELRQRMGGVEAGSLELLGQGYGQPKQVKAIAREWGLNQAELNQHMAATVERLTSLL